MSKQMDYVARMATVSFWILAISNLYLALLPAPYGILLTGLAILIFVAHLFEVGIFIAKYRKQSKNLSLDAFQVLVFGFFHLRRFQGEGK